MYSISKKTTKEIEYVLIFCWVAQPSNFKCPSNKCEKTCPEKQGSEHRNDPIRSGFVTEELELRIAP